MVLERWAAVRLCRAARCTAVRARGLRPALPAESRPFGFDPRRLRPLRVLRAALALRGIGWSAHPRRAALGAPARPPTRLRLIGLRAWRRCALRLRGVGASSDCCRARRLSRIHRLSRDCSPRPRAVKARRAVSSAGACGPPHTRRFSLDGTRPRSLFVAGDELRKDGGNEADPVLRADPTGVRRGL